MPFFVCIYAIWYLCVVVNRARRWFEKFYFLYLVTISVMYVRLPLRILYSDNERYYFLNDFVWNEFYFRNNDIFINSCFFRKRFYSFNIGDSSFANQLQILFQLKNISWKQYRWNTWCDWLEDSKRTISAKVYSIVSFIL